MNFFPQISTVAEDVVAVITTEIVDTVMTAIEGLVNGTIGITVIDSQTEEEVEAVTTGEIVVALGVIIYWLYFKVERADSF